MCNIDDTALQKELLNLWRAATKRLPDIKKNEVVFHYTSPEGLRGITANKCLWATDINYLNDTSESRYIYQLAKELAQKNKDCWDKGFIDELVERCDTIIEKRDLSDRLISSYMVNYYVVSFCLEQDNLNMWKYYTKTENSIGYHIGFKNLVANSSIPDCQAGIFPVQRLHRKVLYDKKKQERILEDFLGKYAAIYSAQSDWAGEMDVRISTEIFLEYFSVFFKHPSFSDEKEYRIVICDDHLARIKDVHYRIKDGVFIPYVELSFDKSCVESIGISPSAKQAAAEYSVKRMLEKEYNLGDRKFYRSSIPFNP